MQTVSLVFQGSQVTHFAGPLFLKQYNTTVISIKRDHRSFVFKDMDFDPRAERSVYT